MTTLDAIPADVEEVDLLSWALDVIAHDPIPTKRVADRILRQMVEDADFLGMDKLLDYARAHGWTLRVGYEQKPLPENSFEYVMAHLGGGDGECLGALEVGLKHFLVTANFPALEAVFEECIREVRDKESSDDADRAYKEACLSVACPACGADVQRRCVGPKGKPTTMHAARARAANQLTMHERLYT